MVALFTAQAVIYFLAKYADLTVNGQSQGILTVLVFGAGTDYALLLVARYREELRRHEDRHEAMAFALHRAAPAIVASAATVVLGMLCLLFAEMNSTAGLGPVAAIGIAVDAAGDDHPAARAAGDQPAAGSSGPAARRSARPSRPRRALGPGRHADRRPRPRAVWVGTAARAGRRLPRPVHARRPGPDHRGLRTPRSSTRSSASRCSPTHGLVDQSNPLHGRRQRRPGPTQVAEALAGVDGLGELNTDARRSRTASPDHGATIAATSPSQAAFDTVEAVRDAVHGVDGADALVGGTSAIYLDIENASAATTWSSSRSCSSW